MKEEKDQKVKDITNKGFYAQQKGDYKTAIGLYKKALKLSPNFLIAANNLANIYNIQEKFDLSYPLLKKVEKIDPEYIHGNFNFGYYLWKIGKPIEASEKLKKVINKNERYFDAYLILGLCYSRLENYKLAIEVYKEALLIKPDIEAVLNNLGNAYKDFGLWRDAEKVFLSLIKVNPEFPPAYTSLALLYKVQEKYDLALKYVKLLVKKEPSNYLGYYTLAEIYFEKGRFMDSLTALNIALRNKPKDAKSILLMYECSRNICDWDLAAELENTKEFKENVSSWISLLASEDPEVNLKCAVNDTAKISVGIKSTFTTYSRVSKKIRIGYLSADLRDHPVGHLVHRMFELHDRNKFEVNVFSYGKNDNSIYRKNIIKGCDKFFDLYGFPSQEIANIIYKEKIDILIDLMGTTYQSKPEILARRPAKIQIQYLGFPGTSGATYIDYLIADEVVVPKNDSKYYSEKVIRLPNCFMVTDGFLKVPDSRFKRNDFGLPEDKIVFSSFVSPIKIDKRSFLLWLGILKKVTGSVLWLRDANPYTVDNLKNFSKSQGVDPKRLIFSNRIPDKVKHLERLSLADIGLDTLVYGGHTTTNDYLWAGVPVVSLNGRHFASKVASSILISAGIPECVAKTERQYEDISVAFAQNKQKLAELRQKIARKQKTAPFFDTKLFIKNFEEKLLEII